MSKKTININQEYKSKQYYDFIGSLLAFIWIFGIFTIIYIDDSTSLTNGSTVGTIIYLILWVVFSGLGLCLFTRSLHLHTYKYFMSEEYFILNRPFKNYKIYYTDIEKLHIHKYDSRYGNSARSPKKPMIRITVKTMSKKYTFAFRKHSQDYDQCFISLRTAVPKKNRILSGKSVADNNNYTKYLNKWANKK